MAKARAGIEKLVHLTPQTAQVIHGDAGEDHSRPMRCRWGSAAGAAREIIPVDGVITAGADGGQSGGDDRRILPVDKRRRGMRCLRERSTSSALLR